MRVRRGEDEPFEIMLIPMIDCMLVIIIFFLVATTLKQHSRELPITLPDSAAATQTEDRPEVLIVGVDRQGRTYLGDGSNARPVGTEELHRRLRETAQQNTARRIRIDADRAAAFESVVRLLDLCEFEGLRNVGVHTRADEQGR